MGLLHLGDGHIEWGAACIQNVASGCYEDVRAVHGKRIALSHISLQAVEGAILGDLQKASS